MCGPSSSSGPPALATGNLDIMTDAMVREVIVGKDEKLRLKVTGEAFDFGARYDNNPHVRDGLLPNNFPDSGDADPGYNTVDANLPCVGSAAATGAKTSRP